MNQDILYVLHNLQSRYTMIPLEMLEDLKENIDALRSSSSLTDITNLIVNDFYDFTLPECEFPIRSVILVARQHMLIPLYFHWKGKKIPIMNEPIITNQHLDTENYLNEHLNHMGYHVQETYGLPMKTLAVRSGLCKYGRNNITYTSDFGSFIGLQAFYTDITCEEYIWRELCRMEECDSCKACMNNCPTKAILEDEQMIHVERCMTYLNEFIDLCEFPDWLSPLAHNCLHGCMKCQLACPMNKHVDKESKEYVEFSEEETQLLLAGTTKESLPELLRYKLDRLGLVEYLHLIPRNLQVLFDKAEQENR